MAYIHAKTAKDKTYYTLRASIRKGKKTITKDIYNLGSDLSKISLNELQKKFPNELKNSYSVIKNKLNKHHHLEKAEKEKIKENKYFDKEQICQINAVLIHYKRLSTKRKKEIMKNVNVKFITENISIESLKDNLTSKKTKNLLEKRIYPKNIDLFKIYMILNIKEILNFLEKEKPPINISLLKTIHKMFLKNTYRTEDFRTHEIKIPKKAFKPTLAKNINFELKKLISWYYKNKTKIHPLALIILFHHKFEKIHPFIFGNGAIGRILKNYMLLQFNYPPIIILRKSKEEYYKVLKKANKDLNKDLLNTNTKHYKPLIDFMYKQFVKTYWDNFI